MCPKIESKLNYYTQKYDNNYYKIATIFAEKYMEWAWSVEGSNEFPDYLYEKDESDIFLKYKVSEFFKNKQPEGLEELSERNQREI
ncbi:MAG: hypothetical protein ABEI13_00230, partial [Candidatus Paceibacteria bacterium]